MNNFFEKIYPFTTENINGYIRNFDLSNKSLLTVGSSGDQIINASFFDCSKYSVIDICPYTKFYFYLKKAALITLSYDEFLCFFCYLDYPKMFEENEMAFNLESFEKLKPILKLLDYDSFVFWDNLFSLYSPLIIRTTFFNSDEEKIKVLKEINLYLKDEVLFDKAKILIKDVNPDFIIGDIFEVNISDKYDNIFLSNLGSFYDVLKLRELVNKLNFNLNDNGKMLLCYLYQTVRGSEYKNDYASIYDLNKTYDILGEYITSFESFPGVKGILFNDYFWKRDSILVYKKTK